MIPLPSTCPIFLVRYEGLPVSMLTGIVTLPCRPGHIAILYPRDTGFARDQLICTSVQTHDLGNVVVTSIIYFADGTKSVSPTA